jgi:hypothetical protein
MAREYDRPATITALVNALVVYLLPLVFVWVISRLPDHRIGSSVTARGPDYLMNRARAISCCQGFSPARSKLRGTSSPTASRRS